jgi:hypothetical protein
VPKMPKKWLLAAVLALNLVGGTALLFGAGFSADEPTGTCGYYVNSSGHRVPRPCGNWRREATPPVGATAKCLDGTWSWSEHPRAPGTCSRHGGVASYQ